MSEFLLKIKESAELLDVHPNTIRNLMASGELKAVRVGPRIVRINKQDVLNLLTPYKGGEHGVWN